MSVFKDEKTNKWYAMVRFTDWQRLFLIFKLSVLNTHACQCIIVSED